MQFSYVYILPTAEDRHVGDFPQVVVHSEAESTSQPNHHQSSQNHAETFDQHTSPDTTTSQNKPFFMYLDKNRCSYTTEGDAA